MKNKWIGLSIFLFCVMIGQMIWLQSRSETKTHHRHLVPMKQAWVKEPAPRPLSEFELIGAKNRPFRLADLQNQWHIFVFGYTACTDVCPLTLGFLAGALEALRQQGFKNIPRGVFVSIDSDWDSPDKVAAYAVKHHPDFLGVTGTPAALKNLLHALGSDYHIDRDQGIFNHPSSLFLINPKAELIGMFIHPRGSVSLKEAIQSVLKMEMKTSELS